MNLLFGLCRPTYAHIQPTQRMEMDALLSVNSSNEVGRGHYRGVGCALQKSRISSIVYVTNVWYAYYLVPDCVLYNTVRQNLRRFLSPCSRQPLNMKSIT